MHTTIIYDRFRFPREKSTAFDWFSRVALPKGYSVSYRTEDDRSAFPPNTDRVLLLGSRTLGSWTNKRSLFTENCYPQTVIHSGRAYPAIATFHPQDAYDFKRNLDDDHVSTESDKDFTATSPNNWMFWIKAAVDKLLVRGPKPPVPMDVVIYPRLCDAIAVLMAAKGRNLYIDIETRRADQGLNCIGFAIDNGPVYVVPAYRYNDIAAYGSYPLFLRALAVAMGRNRIVLHNSGFDLIVLSAIYHIPFGDNIYDTMVAHHRCFPEVEKSLAHAIAYWTWEPFHKDQGGYPHSVSQEQRYWHYNARDVHCTRLVHHAQLDYIKANPGLTASVNQAMDSLVDYLTMTVLGVDVDDYKLALVRLANHKRLKQYQRIIDLLVGRPFNALSSQQCVNYFHKKLGYKVIARSAETGAPSLDSKALYQLRLKNNNPLIDAILRYRALAKEQSMLEFEAWPFPKAL